MKKRCIDCEYFEERMNECRRNPPVVDTDAASMLADFPVVNHNSWCGEYKEREIKQ